MMDDRVVDEPVIAVEHVTAHYGSRKVLDDISLTIRRGEILVVMGGSGSGKSTLLRHLLALEELTSGTVRLLGRDVNRLGNRELAELRRHMGVAFQGGALFSSMTLLDNLLLPLTELTNLDEQARLKKARQCLEEVELSGSESLMPAELSGGMVKRGALARAIVLDPEILFCDEPSSGLDPATSAAIDQLLLHLRDRLCMTIVVVTHDVSSAFTIADRIAIIDRGALVALGTVEEIRNTADKRVQNLVQICRELPKMAPRLHRPADPEPIRRSL